jgi:hypothetical protein
MKKMALLLALLLVVGASSADAQRIRTHQTLTVTALAVFAFTITDQSTNFAYVTVETQAIRWWDDGTNPTTTAGHLTAAGSSITLNGRDNVVNFKCIATAGTATVFGSLGRP